MIEAKILLDSINSANDCRLTTFIVTFPRIVLAEFNTHRALSRNSSSSRAIGFEKMLKMVEETPFIPIRFQKEHKGMQGYEYYEGEDHDKCVEDWLAARDAAIKAAKSFRLSITKQLLNRLIEPYLYQKVIVSATDYENFFNLRFHEDTEIHFQDLAGKMLKAYNGSEPKVLKPGEFHIPFGDKCPIGTDPAKRLKIATARCARLSYMTFDNEMDMEKDIGLFEKLKVSGHWSAFEHSAVAVESGNFIGNFRGFQQYRKSFKDENRKDSRVIKKTVRDGKVVSQI